MKKLIISTGFIFLNLVTFGQSSDSTKIKNLENEVRHIQLNLEKSHNEFQAGCMIIGGAAVVGSISIFSDDKFSKTYVPWIAVGMGVVGTVVVIHSHKWIGKASVSGLSLTYKF